MTNENICATIGELSDDHKEMIEKFVDVLRESEKARSNRQLR